MFLAYGGIFLSSGMKKGSKNSQDQSSIMLLFELNSRHNAVVLRVTLKSIVLKFSSIMYLTHQSAGKKTCNSCFRGSHYLFLARLYHALIKSTVKRVSG